MPLTSSMILILASFDFNPAILEKSCKTLNLRLRSNIKVTRKCSTSKKQHDDNRSKTFCSTMYQKRGEIELSDITTFGIFIIRTVADGNEEE